MLLYIRFQFQKSYLLRGSPQQGFLGSDEYHNIDSILISQLKDEF